MKKYKLVFVIDSLLSGGAERVVTVLANNFVLKNYDVTIISKQNHKPFYNIDKRVTLIFSEISIQYTNYLRRLYTTFLVYKFIFKTLKGIAPDFILPISTSTSGVIILLGRLLGTKVIACEHNNHKADYHQLINRLTKLYLYKYATAVAVLTDRDKNDFYGTFLKRVYVIPNPLSIQPISKINFENKKKAIIAIGNLNEWYRKGFDNLIRIFSEVNQLYPEWDLHIAGDGNNKFLMKLASSHNLQDKVKFLGSVENIDKLLPSYPIYTLTSRWEGLPMALLESMSQGLACIAFDCLSGPRELINDGKSGILVEDQNVDLFIFFLLNLIGNNKKRKLLAMNAIEATKKFSVEAIIVRWENVFNDLDDL